MILDTKIRVGKEHKTVNRDHIIDAVSVSIFVAFGFAFDFVDLKTGPLKTGNSSIVVGLYLLAISIFFFLSYFYAGKSYVLRVFRSISHNGSYPRGKKWAIFYIGITLFMSTMAVLIGNGLVQWVY